MFGEEVDKEIKIASDNEIKNSFFNFELQINGLDKVIPLFFPSLRQEMVLRYRAETIAKIGIEAYRMAKEEDIKINPIPPKIALPLIEKMSLEHEPEMYEKWAKLLIAAGVNANPIHQQYANILENLSNNSANLLKGVYTKQTEQSDIEQKFDEYIDKTRFQRLYKEVEKKAKIENDGVGEYGRSAISWVTELYLSFTFPLIIYGTEKSKMSYKPIFTLNENINMVTRADNYLILTKEDKNKLLVLEKLGLVKYQYLNTNSGEDEDGKEIFIETCGVLLTKFGYSFVDCLEHPTK